MSTYRVSGIIVGAWHTSGIGMPTVLCTQHMSCVPYLAFPIHYKMSVVRAILIGN